MGSDAPGGPRRGRVRGLLLASALLLALGAAWALETDQYYAWGEDLVDATPLLNAKVNLEIERVLRDVNRRGGGARLECSAVRRRVVRRFRSFIFHPVELWAINTTLIDRAPGSAAEWRDLADRGVYRDFGFLDLASWMPWSPTIRVDGVMIGTDKLSHFFSEGWWYYRRYTRALRAGATVEQAEIAAIDLGILSERSILGLGSSGVFSVADLEANYQGMRFIVGLCDGEQPMLEKTAQGWRLERRFDLRDHVSPEWDESFQPSVYTRRSWAKVRPAMKSYCERLRVAGVRRERAAYRAREAETLTERRLQQKIREGKVLDPAAFSIEHVCGVDGPLERRASASATPRSVRGVGGE